MKPEQIKNGKKKKLGKPISAFRNQDYLYAQYNLHKKETLQNIFLQNPIQPISTFVCPQKKKLKNLHQHISFNQLKRTNCTQNYPQQPNTTSTSPPPN